MQAARTLTLTTLASRRGKPPGSMKFDSSSRDTQAACACCAATCSADSRRTLNVMVVASAPARSRYSTHSACLNVSDGVLSFEAHFLDFLHADIARAHVPGRHKSARQQVVTRADPIWQAVMMGVRIRGPGASRHSCCAVEARTAASCTSLRTSRSPRSAFGGKRADEAQKL